MVSEDSEPRALYRSRIGRRLKRASRHLKKGSRDRARDGLRSALDLFPSSWQHYPRNDVDLVLRAADVAADLDGSVKIANLLRAYLKEEPRDPRGHAALVRVLVAAQKEEEALAACEEGLDRLPDANSLALLQATVLQRLGRDEEALVVLWAVAEEGKAWPEALSVIEASAGPSGRLLAVRGRRLAEEGRPEPALEAFQRALEEDPRCVDALEGQTRIFVAEGRNQAATEAVQEALSIESTRAPIWEMKAIVEERRGETDEAIRSLQVSVRYDPQNLEAVRRLGGLLHEAGRDDDALEYYGAASEGGGDDIAFLQGWRATLGAQGQWEDFRAVTRRLGDLGADGRALAIDEAWSWMESGEPSKAEALLVQVLDEGAEAASLGRIAELAIRMEAWDLARRASRQGLHENPGDRSALRCLGLALRGLNRDTEALKVLSKGIRLYGDLEFLQIKGDILRARGDDKALFQCCEQILRVTPEAVDVYLEMAAIAAGWGKPRRALRLCERGLKAVPENAALRLKRAELLHGEGRYGEAYRAYDALLQGEEDNGPAWKGRGLSLFALKDFQGAAEAFGRAAELGRDAECWYYRGLCLRESATLEEARVAFDLAVAEGGEGAWWMARGLCFRDLGELREALYSFDQALESDSGLDAAVLHKAECLLELKDPREALRCLTEAPTEGEVGHEALRTRIRCLERLDRLQEAYEAAVTLTEAGAPEAGAWMLRAKFARALGLTTEARLSWTKASKILPRDPAPKVEEAAMLLELEDPSEALRLSEEALSLDRRNERAALYRGKALADLGNHEVAVRAFDEALALHPGMPAARRGKAASLAHSGQFEEALRIAEDLEALRPADPQTYAWKAQILAEGAQWGEALKTLNQALYYGGGEPEILAQKGLVLGELDRVEEGLTLLQSAVSEDRPDPALATALATLLIRAERYEPALEVLGSGALAGPPSRQIVQLRAEALGGVQRWEEAWETLAAAAQAGPIPTETWVRLSALYERQGDGPGAVACYDRALAGDDRSRDLWKGRGRLCADLDRWPEALESFQAAVDAAPEDEEALCGLGRAYGEVDLFDEAREAYRRALAVNPASREAERGRQEVEARSHQRRVEGYALRVLQFELTHGRPASKEEAFRYCDVPMEVLPDVLGYVNAPAPLDILSLEEGEIRALETRSREVLFALEGEGLPRLAEVVQDHPEMPAPEARRVLEYIRGVVETDLPREETPGLERLMKLAMELPEPERDTLSLARELGLGIHRAKMVELALHRFEQVPPGQAALPGPASPGTAGANRCRRHGTEGIYQHLCGQYLCSTCIVGGRCPICRHPVSASLSALSRSTDEPGDRDAY